MRWKDLWTEFLIKLRLYKPPAPRRPNPRHDVRELLTTANIIKGRAEREFDARLARRSRVTSYLKTDDILFEPYVDLLALTTIGSDNYSFMRDIGGHLLRTITLFEHNNAVTVNKSHLFFGLAINSIYMNDTINAMIYWELSQQDESQTLLTAYNPTIAINSAADKFTSVINPIDSCLNDNDLYSGLHTRYLFVTSFKTTMTGQVTPEVFAYLASGLRFRQVDYWLRNHFTDMTKLFGQELINSLCILCEANLKNHAAVTQRMLGPIIMQDLVNVNPAVSAVVGASGTGLFLTFPTGTDPQFDANFPLLINRIKSYTLSEVEIKAFLVYGCYMIRNKSLHDFKSTLSYYNNRGLFMDAIGLLFAAVPAIRTL